MKPPNTNIKTRSKVPKVVATTIFLNTEAMKRHKDVDA